MSLPLAAVGAVLAALLEASVLPDLAIAGIRPDLVFIFAVVTAMMVGVEDGLVWAFLGGLMLDVLVPGRSLGATAVALLVVTGLAIAVARVVGPGRRLVAVGTVFGLTFVFQLAVLFILAATSGARPLGLPVREIAFAAVANAVVAALVVVIVRYLIVRFGPAEKMDW